MSTLIRPRTAAGPHGLARTLTRLRALTAAAALTAGAALFAAAPAHAAGAVLSFQSADRYYIPTPHSVYDGDNRLQFRLLAASDTGSTTETPPVHDLRIAVDATALAGEVALTDLGYGCAAGGPGGLVVTCDRGTVQGLDSLTAPVTVKPLDSAPVGFAADIVLTATASDAATVTRTVHAVIGRPHLATARESSRTGLPPGARVAFQPSFANTGEVATDDGFQVLFSSSGHLTADGPRHRNCHYAPDGGRFWCGFDQNLAPGTAYGLAEPLAFRTTEATMAGTVSYLFFPTGTQDGYDLIDDSPPPGFPETGTGPALGLVPVGLGGLTQNTGGFGVTADQSSDFQAIGGAIAGKRGEVVDVPLGVRNAGPGGFSRTGVNPGVSFDVTMPQGVTVLSVFGDVADEPVSWLCSPAKSAPRYHCAVHDPLDVGDAYTYDFRVRIDRAVAGAVGQVRVVQPTALPSHDPLPANDAAPVTLTVASAPGSPPSPSPTAATPPASTPAGPPPAGTSAAGGAGASGPPGGRLAATGSPASPLLAALATAALLAGATACLAARRR